MFVRGITKVQKTTGANSACCRLAPYLFKNWVTSGVKTDMEGKLQQDMPEILS
jgi:hypothetical protein